VANEVDVSTNKPKKKMSKGRKLLIALGVIAGIVVGAWVLVITPAINKIATEQIQAAGFEGATIEIHADGAKISMPTLPASFGGEGGFTGSNIVFEFGGLGVDDINLLMQGAESGKIVLPEGTHFTMTADSFAEFTNFSFDGTDQAGTFAGTVTNEAATALAAALTDGKLVDAPEGTLASFLTDIVLTPGSSGTVLTASVDMAKVLALLAQ
jgi:hypothetical protein